MNITDKELSLDLKNKLKKYEKDSNGIFDEEELGTDIKGNIIYGMDIYYY